MLLDFPQPSWFGRIASAGATNVKLQITNKTFGDFGTIHAADPAKTLAGNQLAAGDTGFFLVRTDNAANLMKLVGTPTTTDIAIASLAADESVITTVDRVPGVETAVFPSQPNKWVAVAVTGTVAGSFDLSGVVGTEDTSYATSTPAAPAYASICTPQNVLAMHDDGSDFGSDDEGLSDLQLPLPSGFSFFGADVGQVQVSTNGWLSFFPQTNSFGLAGNTTLPSARQPLALVAPYWSDLFGVVACAEITATTMIVEWQGESAISGAPVAFQVHLDATTGAVEFVYNPDTSNMADDGTDATIGLQDFVGGHAVLYDFDGLDGSGNPFSLQTSLALLATPN